MTNKFDSPKALISHARDEIKEAEALIERFVKEQKGTRVIYTDPQTGEQIHRIRIEGPNLPAKLANIVKDAAGNLRDALDHTTYSAASVLAGGEPTNTGFPFAKDAAGVKGELGSRRLAGNPPEIRPLLEGFKPYEGGNDTLWAMNQIRNPNTHRFIVPVGTAAMSSSIGIRSGTITSGSLGYSRWNPSTKEVEYLRIGAGSHLDYKVEITINVAF